MKTTLFLSVSIDGYIADQNGIPAFPEGAWEDWCALVNDVGSLIAGRSSYEQLQGEESSALLTPRHKVVLSSQNLELDDSTWQHAQSPAGALKLLEQYGVEEVIIGGGRAVAHAFIAEQLIDYIIIDLQPVAFGVGTPVFGDKIDVHYLKLIDSQPLNGNAIRLRYHVVRD